MITQKTPINAQKAKQPLILRYHRLMDAFSKSDDERDFFLDNVEGFIVFADLDKDSRDVEALEKELASDPSRYHLIPKLTFYETKKIMEEFVNDKVYDIDTKEKLLEIIQSKDPRENFLEFIYDHHTEVEKWHQYYQERSRIRIIEWLRNNAFHFVFEEDLDFPQGIIDKLKKNLFQRSSAKEIVSARKALEAKSKIYYSSEALNPRPKRGRPPKQVSKVEVEMQKTSDIYLTVPEAVNPFLYIPDITSASEVTFSSKYGTEEELLASLRTSSKRPEESKIDVIFNKLASLCGTIGNEILTHPEMEEEKTSDDERHITTISSKRIEEASKTVTRKKPLVVKKNEK